MQRRDWHFLSQHAYELALCFAAIDQARKVNRTRGAWRQPALTSIVSRLEGELKSAYETCEHGIALALAGVQTQAADAERAAISHHGLDEIDSDEPARSDVLAAVLLLLGAFRSRHLELTNAAIEESFALGRTQVLKRLQREEAVQQPGTIALLPQTKNRFESDVQRLYRDLLDGSKRAPDGVQEIADPARYPTIGAQIVALRSLFFGEQFRLSLLAEHATWWGWVAGFRAGAADSAAALSLAGEPLPRFEWRGPNDSRCCTPCKRRFTNPIVTVTTIADLPDPSSICEFGINCRHYFAVV